MIVEVPCEGCKLVCQGCHAQIDPRIEAIARGLCVLAGRDPDQIRGYATGESPAWQSFTLEARKFLTAYDAVKAYEATLP